MHKRIQLRSRLKAMITLFSALALCCATLSYAGYDKNQDKIPVFYWLGDEREAIEFDQAITNASAYFGAQQAFQKHSPAKYRLLHDVKQHHFQRQQIALMQDVLTELKAINHKLTDRPAASKPTKLHQIFKEKMREIEIPDSGVIVSLVGDVKFAFDKGKEELLKIYAPKIAALNIQLEEVANHWNPSNNKDDEFVKFREVAEAFNNQQPTDNDRDNILRLPVGSVTPQSRIGDAIADYFTNQLAKQNALFAKNGMTDFAMNPPKSAVIDKPVYKISRSSGDGSIEWVSPPNFSLINGEALIAFAQEIFNRESFQDEIKELIQQEVYKALPLSTQQSQSNDGDNSIDYFTGGIVKKGNTYVKGSAISESFSADEASSSSFLACRSC